MTVTERIYALLKEKNLQQIELAKRINCTRSTISYIFTKNRAFGADDIIPIANFLGVSVHYLLTGEEEELPKAASVGMLTEDEAELLLIYHALDREGKTNILYEAYQQRSKFNEKQNREKRATTTA